MQREPRPESPVRGQELLLFIENARDYGTLIYQSQEDTCFKIIVQN
jgi:hypothetical protein